LSIVLGASLAHAQLDANGYIEQWPGNVNLQYVLAGSLMNPIPTGQSLKPNFDAAWATVANNVPNASPAQQNPVCALIQANAPAGTGATLTACNVPQPGELRALPLPAPSPISYDDILWLKYIVPQISFTFDVPAPWYVPDPHIMGTFDLEIDMAFTIDYSIDGRVMSGDPAFTSGPVQLGSLTLSAMNANLTTDSSHVSQQQLQSIEAQIDAVTLASTDPTLQPVVQQVQQELGTLNGALHSGALLIFAPLSSTPGAVPTFTMNLAMDANNTLLIEYMRDDVAPAAPTGCDPYATVYCGDAVSIYCDPMAGQFALRRGSTTGPIESTDVNWNLNVDVHLQDDSLVTTDPSEEYYVCRQEMSGETCVGPITAILPHEACSPPSTGGGGGGGGGGGVIGTGHGCGRGGCRMM
jgi:hypothetical protein